MSWIEHTVVTFDTVLRYWPYVSGLWSHVMRGWNWLTAKCMTVECQGVSVFGVCACSVDCKWHDSARWTYIMYMYLVCVSVFKLFDMEAELVKCLSNSIWNPIISRVKSGGRPPLTERVPTTTSTTSQVQQYIMCPLRWGCQRVCDLSLWDYEDTQDTEFLEWEQGGIVIQP